MASPTEQLDDALVDALAQSAFVVMGVLTRIAADHEVSLTQMRTLGILRDREPRMAELAGYLGLEKSTMSGLVERAERRGLVSRAASPHDGRAVHVSLTRPGRRLATEAQEQVREALTPVIDRLEGPQRRQLVDLLTQMLPTEPG